jgi:hypothetical protein
MNLKAPTVTTVQNPNLVGFHEEDLRLSLLISYVARTGLFCCLLCKALRFSYICCVKTLGFRYI